MNRGKYRPGAVFSMLLRVQTRASLPPFWSKNPAKVLDYAPPLDTHSHTYLYIHLNPHTYIHTHTHTHTHTQGREGDDNRETPPLSLDGSGRGVPKYCRIDKRGMYIDNYIIDSHVKNPSFLQSANPLFVPAASSQHN